MKNFLQPGETITVTAPLGGVKGGDGGGDLTVGAIVNRAVAEAHAFPPASAQRAELVEVGGDLGNRSHQCPALVYAPRWSVKPPP